MNFKRFFIRLGLLAWFAWLVLIFISLHREVVTYLGFDYWATETVFERQRKKYDCDNKEKAGQLTFESELNCSSLILGSSVDKNDALRAWGDFVYGGIIFPAGLFVVYIVLIYAIAWVLRGLKNG